MLAYLQGLSLGLAYVAPIGVQNLFVINAGLSQPRAAAYRTALIVIFFDVTLALAGFFGIGALIEHSELIRKGVLLAGSLVVMYMGLRLMLSREVAGPAINVNIPLMKTIGMACVVTWFNPQAIIDVSLLLGSFRVALPPEESGLFLWGVVCASCLWFLSLTTIIPNGLARILFLVMAAAFLSEKTKPFPAHRKRALFYGERSRSKTEKPL